MPTSPPSLSEQKQLTVARRQIAIPADLVKQKEEVPPVSTAAPPTGTAGSVPAKRVIVPPSDLVPPKRRVIKPPADLVAGKQGTFIQPNTQSD